MTTINDLMLEMHGGLRRNRYQILVDPPGNFISSQKLNILCKGTSFPNRTIQSAEVSHYGRKYYLRGETNYGNTITFTFYDDANMNLRRTFDYWMSYIDDSRKTGQSAPMTNKVTNDYMRDLEVWQLDNNQKQLYGYTIYDAFPEDLGDITYSGDETDTVVEFNVNFKFSEFAPITARKK